MGTPLWGICQKSLCNLCAGISIKYSTKKCSNRFGARSSKLFRYHLHPCVTAATKPITGTCHSVGAAAHGRRLRYNETMMNARPTPSCTERHRCVCAFHCAHFGAISLLYSGGICDEAISALSREPRRSQQLFKRDIRVTTPYTKLGQPRLSIP
jgi:hypothetical protein